MHCRCCYLQCKLGAIDDAESALKSLPRNPSALYVRAYAKYLSAAESKAKKGSSRVTKLDASAAAAAAAAFQDYLDATPVEDCKRPNAYYFLAMHTLKVRDDGSKGRNGMEAAALQEVEALYNAGLDAEKHLPPFFLPVACSAKDLLGGILPALRAVTQQRVAPQQYLEIVQEGVRAAAGPAKLAVVAVVGAGQCTAAVALQSQR